MPVTPSRFFLCGAAVMVALLARADDTDALFPDSFQSVDVVTSILTDETSMLTGKPAPLNKFTSDDIIRADVWLKWQDIRRPAGKHVRTWSCYKNDTIVSYDHKEGLGMGVSPFDLYWVMHAAPLGVGSFKLELSVDGRTIYTTQFTIAANGM